MRWRWARLDFWLVCGLTGLCAAGCAKTGLFSPFSARRAAESSAMKDDAQVSSRSDRLRTDLAYKAAVLDETRPSSVQELQPQSLRPPPVSSEIAPPSRSGDEPDPRAVIDWLLKERR